MRYQRVRQRVLSRQKRVFDASKMRYQRIRQRVLARFNAANFYSSFDKVF